MCLVRLPFVLKLPTKQHRTTANFYVASHTYEHSFIYCLDVLALHVGQLAHLFVILSSARKKTVHHVTSHT